ncbi:unnamed protein product [Rotaria sordida]|uniref:G-protein coupled receptors family 1 profile domain-containing protein n=1 Tax=Rotaria sordida TaxID=392033 RepID=A0A814F6P0_9BILA|nr:unnamed protein product [Rotaria sordida]
MSITTNFNQTNNGTIRPPPSNRNRSNESDFFRPGRDNDTYLGGNATDQSPEVMLYLLITLVIPSIICFIFLFYNFIHLPHLRSKSSNLFIISLLIINFIHILTDLPFRLYYLSQNQVPFLYPIFCLIWTWYDDILTAVNLFIMAFTSIDRYIFIFHHVFHRRYKRLLYRISMVVCFLFATIWYTVLIFGYPCQNSFIYFSFQCGTLCYLKNSQVLTHFENAIFFMFPLSIIVIGNIILIIHVFIQKRQMKCRHRLGLWRQNFRMISQLMFIAILYMSIYVPSCILLIMGSYVRYNRFQSWAANVRTRYFTHLKYLVIFGYPFMVLVGQKEMHRMIKKNSVEHFDVGG